MYVGYTGALGKSVNMYVLLAKMTTRKSNQSFNSNSFSIYYVLGAILDIRNRAKDKT